MGEIKTFADKQKWKGLLASDLTARNDKETPPG